MCVRRETSWQSTSGSMHAYLRGLNVKDDENNAAVCPSTATFLLRSRGHESVVHKRTREPWTGSGVFFFRGRRGYSQSRLMQNQMSECREAVCTPRLFASAAKPAVISTALYRVGRKGGSSVQSTPENSSSVRIFFAPARSEPIVTAIGPCLQFIHRDGRGARGFSRRLSSFLRRTPIGSAERDAKTPFPRGQISQKHFYCYPYTHEWRHGPKGLCPLYGSLSTSAKSARSWEVEHLSTFAKEFKVPPSKHGAGETPNINSRGETFDKEKTTLSLSILL